MLRRVTIEEVSVLVQPHGALMTLGASRFAALSGLNLVIDAGGGTTDWFVTRGTEPNWSKSGAHQKGMLHCGLAVADGIKKSWRNQYEVMEIIDLAVRTNAEHFTVSGIEYPLAAHRASIDAVLRNPSRACWKAPETSTASAGSCSWAAAPRSGTTTCEGLSRTCSE